MKYHGDEDECWGTCGLCDDCIAKQERIDERRMEHIRNNWSRRFKEALTSTEEE